MTMFGGFTITMDDKSRATIKDRSGKHGTYQLSDNINLQATSASMNCLMPYKGRRDAGQPTGAGKTLLSGVRKMMVVPQASQGPDTLNQKGAHMWNLA